MSIKIKTMSPEDYQQLPDFFENPAISHLYHMVLTLAEELSVQSELNANLQQILINKGLMTQEEIASFTPDEVSQSQRLEQHQAFSQRLLGSLQKQLNPDNNN